MSEDHPAPTPHTPDRAPTSPDRALHTPDPAPTSPDPAPAAPGTGWSSAPTGGDAAPNSPAPAPQDLPDAAHPAPAGIPSTVPPGEPDRDPFNPAGISWTRVSPKLATMQLLVNSISWGLMVVIAAIVALATGIAWLWAVPAVFAALALLILALIPRRVRAWGYTEQADDLVITRGIMFKTLVVVPYGRMQYVDVQAGPVERSFGLAKVQLHTASPGTDAAIPGLVASEAARLRERLASRGESQLAGL